MKILKLLALSLFLVSLGCNAGAYGDALTKCALERTDESGRSAIMHWLFTVLAQHPENKSIYMKNDMSESFAKMAAAHVYADTFGRACKTESDLAVKIEGKEAVQNAIAAVFYSAIGQSFNNADVGIYMNESDKIFTNELEKTRKYSESFKH